MIVIPDGNGITLMKRFDSTNVVRLGPTQIRFIIDGESYPRIEYERKPALHRTIAELQEMFDDFLKLCEIRRAVA